MKYACFVFLFVASIAQPVFAEVNEVKLTEADDLFFYTKNGLETVYNKDGTLFSGAVRKKNEKGLSTTYFYQNGLRNGVIYTNYENGKIKNETTYRNGLKNGEKIIFTESGSPKKKSTYKDNVLDGEMVLFYENGKPEVQKFYKSGKLDGEITYFDEKGSRIRIEHYKDGVKNGLEHIIADDILMEENNYVNGVLDGVIKKYNKDYQTDEIVYKNGKKNGVSKHFNSDGGIEETPYENDSKNGVAVLYYPDNTIAEKTEYVNDKKNGMSEKFSQKGKRLSAETYKNGNKEGISRSFDENGELLKVSYFVNNTELATVDLSQDTELRNFAAANRLGQISKYSSKKMYWYPILWLAINSEDKNMLQALEKDMKMYGAKIDDMSVYQRESKTKFADYTRNLYFGLLPLSYAVDLSSSLEIMQKFATPKQLDAQNPRGGTALQEAIRLNNLEMVRFLLLHKAEINTVKNSDILMQSINENVRLPILEELIKAGAKVDFSVKNGKSPVLVALDRNDANLLQMLKKYGAPLDYVFSDGKNLLFYAYSQAKDAQIVDFLLDNKLDVNQPDNNGNLLILEALKNKDEKMIDKLLSGGVDVNKKNSNGENAVSYALENKNTTDIIKKILAQNADYSGVFGVEKQPLWKLAAQNNANFLKQILDKNGGADKPDATGVIPLQTLINLPMAEDSKDAEVAKVLLSYITPEWLTAHPEYWQQVLQAKNLPLFEKLAKIGFNPNVKDKNDQAAIWIVVKNNYEAVWRQILVGLKADVNVIDQNGKTLLQFAVEKNDDKLAEYFLQNGADIKLLPQDSLAKLTKDMVKITKLLLDNGVDTSYVSPDGVTLLMSAVQNLNEVLFDYLLDNGADVNVGDTNSNTALFYLPEAMKNNSQMEKDVLLAQIFEVINKLKQHGADVNKQNGNGETVLIRLAKERSQYYDELEKMLIEQGVDTAIKDQYGKTAADYALP